MSAVHKLVMLKFEISLRTLCFLLSICLSFTLLCAKTDLFYPGGKFSATKQSADVV